MAERTARQSNIELLRIVAAIGVWCALAEPEKGAGGDTFNFSSTFVLFAIAFVVIALGYLLGSISIKGVSLGTAGVFLVAILVGWLCTLDFGDVPEHFISKVKVVRSFQRLKGQFKTSD